MQERPLTQLTSLQNGTTEPFISPPESTKVLTIPRDDSAVNSTAVVTSVGLRNVLMNQKLGTGAGRNHHSKNAKSVDWAQISRKLQELKRDSNLNSRALNSVPSSLAEHTKMNDLTPCDYKKRPSTSMSIKTTVQYKSTK